MYVRLNSHKLLCSGAVPHDPAPEGVLHGHWRRGSPGQDEPAERPKVSLTARKLEGYGVIRSFLFAELSRSKRFRVFASLRIRREGILLTPTTLPTAISLPSRLWQRNIRTGSFSCRKEPSWACVCVCVSGSGRPRRRSRTRRRPRTGGRSCPRRTGSTPTASHLAHLSWPGRGKSSSAYSCPALCYSVYSAINRYLGKMELTGVVYLVILAAVPVIWLQQICEGKKKQGSSITFCTFDIQELSSYLMYITMTFFIVGFLTDRIKDIEEG